MTLPPAPRWAVPVRIPFVVLVLSGACTIKTAWLFSHGALTSPLNQHRILERVQESRRKRDRASGNIRDAIALPFAPCGGW